MGETRVFYVPGPDGMKKIEIPEEEVNDQLKKLIEEVQAFMYDKWKERREDESESV